MKTLVTIGYVQVETTVKDCEGTTRTVDFPRLGKSIGAPRFHWTVAKYVRDAKAAARAALKGK